MKKCTGCKKNLKEDQFYTKKRSKVRADGTVHTWEGTYAKCKKCTNSHNVESRDKYGNWYKGYRKNNKERISEQSKKHYVETNLKWIELIKTVKALECESCGYSKTWAGLDFHHKDPREKETTIHAIMKASVPTEEAWCKMKTELKKCQVLCATCHREEHMKYDYFRISAEKGFKTYNETKNKSRE